MKKRIDLSIKPSELEALGDDEFRSLAADVITLLQTDTQENQLNYYKPVSEESVKVHTSSAKKIAVFGGNGCLPLTAPVLMADGSWKQLGAIAIGDKVMAADPDSRTAVPSRVTRTWRSGRKLVYRVNFSDGGCFEATAEHRVPMLLGSGRKTSKGYLKKAKKRVLGEYIEPIRRRGVANPSKRISCISPKDIQFTKTKALFPPYLLGALLGDGTMTGNSPKFHNKDSDILTRVSKDLKLFDALLVKYQGCDFGITMSHQIGSTRTSDKSRKNTVKEKLKKLHLWGCNSYTKFIPDWVFGLSRRQRMEVLAGLIDTDGAESSYSTCSHRLAEGFCMLVRSLGGKATSRAHIAKSQNGTEVPYFQIYWRMNDRVPVCLTYKQPVNQRGKEIEYTRRICRSVDQIGAMECGDIEVDHPAHCYITRDYTIVSNSSKTETCLVEMIICCTGIIPESLKGKFDKKKFRGPIKARVVCESLTTVLQPIMLPKLRWNVWTGVDEPGGERGHWGWVPRHCLIKGEWEKSWSEKYRTLRLFYFNPDTKEKEGESTIQFMSKDQDPSDFASGDYHLILHDEPPPLAIWRENEARTMRVNGRTLLAMTWPDDPAIAVEWIHDDIYDKGQPGPNKDPNIDCINLYTTDNLFLDQKAISEQAAAWSKDIRDVRIFGKSLRFSNLIHPLFTDQEQNWCFSCNQATVVVKGVCSCGSHDTIPYNHVVNEAIDPALPVIFGMDPHPRKPHMYAWYQIDAKDDFVQIFEDELAEDIPATKRRIEEIENDLGLWVVKRFIDPNMARSPSGTRREITWQDEFSNEGLWFDLASTSDTGRSRVNEYLKPDKYTLLPRLRVRSVCAKTILQFKRYVWDDHKLRAEKELKQLAKPKHDDYPTLFKYLMNFDISFSGMTQGAPVIKRFSSRRDNYGETRFQQESANRFARFGKGRFG